MFLYGLLVCLWSESRQQLHMRKIKCKLKMCRAVILNKAFNLYISKMSTNVVPCYIAYGSISIGKKET